MVNPRNILIVGITGSGKSALANVLTNTNEFEEESSSTSVTKGFKKSNVFEWEGKKYQVIDNIGFGDAVISEETILYEIGKGIYLAEEGIGQVLFIFRGRFSPEQIQVFNLLKKLISESGITKFTTLVRTRFVNFKNSEKCKEDKNELLTQGEELRKIIESCNDVIYVDNPPIPIINKEDSEGEIEDKKGKISRNEKKRKESRKIVLDHLVNLANSHHDDVYKIEKWDRIYSTVANYIERERELEENSSLVEQDKQEEIKKIKKEASAEIKSYLNPELVAAIEQIK